MSPILITNKKLKTLNKMSINYDITKLIDGLDHSCNRYR
jgi:hypothetical protein